MTAYLSDKQLDAIFLRYKDMVYRIAILRTKNQTDADDVFQEVFMRLTKHGSTLQSEEHLKAWLIRVTINCCNSLLSDSFRKKTVSYSDYMKKNANDDDWEETETDSALLIEDEYRETERNGLLESIKRLPTTYRDVIYLFYYEELSIRRISEILKTSEGAVKTRLSRARSILKDQLTGVSGVE